MSLSRFVVGAAAVALMAATTPATAHAQAGWKTSCTDGTTTKATGANACDGHGGIHHVKTTIAHRAPSRTVRPGEPARVAQAGTPAPGAKPHYEEHRGWRWSRHRDEARHEEKHRRVRCRDGREDTIEGKGKQVCKHHGGVAH
jgi:hypothetical protein